MLTELLRRRCIAVFLGLEGILYCLFLWLDRMNYAQAAPVVKYLSIVLCAVAALLSAAFGGDRLVALGLCLTLVADLTLLFFLNHSLFGVMVFYAVQVVYLIRMSQAKQGRAWLSMRVALFVLLLLFLNEFHLLDELTGAAALYISFFFVNLLQGVTLSGKEGQLFFWGLLLFFCCDLCVGLFNFPLSLPGWLHTFAEWGMWIFYLPGQVLIVLSGQYPLTVEVIR